MIATAIPKADSKRLEKTMLAIADRTDYQAESLSAFAAECLEQRDTANARLGEIIAEAHELFSSSGCKGQFSVWLRDCGLRRTTAYRLLNGHQRRKQAASYDHLRPSVYFIRAARTIGPIKIGIAADVAHRLSQMQVGSPVQLEVIGIVVGAGRQLESELHERFSHLRLRGEWFRPGQSLLDFIESVKA